MVDILNSSGLSTSARAFGLSHNHQLRREGDDDAKARGPKIDAAQKVDVQKEVPAAAKPPVTVVSDVPAVPEDKAPEARQLNASLIASETLGAVFEAVNVIQNGAAPAAAAVNGNGQANAYGLEFGREQGPPAVDKAEGGGATEPATAVPPTGVAGPDLAGGSERFEWATLSSRDVEGLNIARMLAEDGAPPAGPVTVNAPSDEEPTPENELERLLRERSGRVFEGRGLDVPGDD